MLVPPLLLFDVFQQCGTGQSIATIPEFLRELSLHLPHRQTIQAISHPRTR